MHSEVVRFPGANGDALVGRWMTSASGSIRGTALFAHCFTCGKDLHATRRVAEGLVHEGFGVLRFDFTGLGESEGDFASTNFQSNVADLEAAMRFVHDRAGGPDLLVGHSLGGAAVLVAARKHAEVRAVATIGAPSSTAHLAESLARAAGGFETGPEVTVQLAGRPFQIRAEFVEDLRHERVLSAARELDRPLLILHAPADQIVGIEHARALYEAARHPKSFISLDGMDHLLTGPKEHAAFVADMIATWARRYLHAVQPAPEAAPPGTVRTIARSQGFTQDIAIQAHRLVADEPASVGGADLGPTPTELVLAGLGACTAMTLRMYAARKEWPLLGVQVDVRRRSGDGGEKPRLERTVAILGPLDADQRTRLIEIAERCPVHRMLSEGIAIDTSAARDA